LSTSRKVLFTLASLGLAAFAACPASAQSLITNGSFEANSFVTYPGYVNVGNGTIDSWTSNNNFSGLNPFSGPSKFGGQSPFANNGVSPDGGNIAFLETGNNIGAQSNSIGTTTLTQTLKGLTTGQTYQVSFYDNSRSFQDDPILSLLLDNNQIYTSGTGIKPVGGSTQYNFVTTSFIASAASQNLTFSSTSATSGGDATALIDGVKVNASAAPEPSQIGMLALVAAGLGALVLKARKRSAAPQAA